MRISEVVDRVKSIPVVGIKISETTIKTYVKNELISPPKTGFTSNHRGRYSEYQETAVYEAYAAKKMLSEKISVEAVRLARESALKNEMPAWWPKQKPKNEVPVHVERASPVRWVQFYFEAKYEKGVMVPDEFCGLSHRGLEGVLPQGVINLNTGVYSDKVVVTVNRIENKRWVEIDRWTLKYYEKPQ